MTETLTQGTSYGGTEYREFGSSPGLSNETPLVEAHDSELFDHSQYDEPKEKNAGIAPETYQQFPELKTAEFDLAALKKGQELGFFETKNSLDKELEHESREDEEKEPLLAGLVEFEPDRSAAHTPNIYQEQKEMRTEIAFFSAETYLEGVPPESQTESIALLDQDVKDIEKREEQLFKNHADFLESLPGLQHDMQNQEIDSLLEEENDRVINEPELSLINPHRLTVDIKEPASTMVIEEQGQEDPIRQAEIGLFNQEQEASTLNEKTSNKELEQAKEPAVTKSELTELLSQQELKLAPEQQELLATKVQETMTQVQTEPTEPEELLATEVESREGMNIEQEIELEEHAIHTTVESDLSPEEQLDRHLTELARLETYFLLQEGPGDSTDKHQDLRYRGDTEGREKLQLMLADQAALVKVASLLVEHQNDLKTFSRQVETEFEGYQPLSIDLNDHDKERDPYNWHEVEVNQKGEMLPGSEISIEHAINPEGASLKIIIKPPQAKEEYEFNRPASTTTEEEIPGSVEKEAYLTTSYY